MEELTNNEEYRHARILLNEDKRRELSELFTLSSKEKQKRLLLGLCRRRKEKPVAHSIIIA